MKTLSGFVSIIGRPNVGKSSLLNKILKGKISVVTPKAQTTRDEIKGIYTEKNTQIVFLDTPGIHNAKQGGLNEVFVNRAIKALESSDIIWFLCEPEMPEKSLDIFADLLKKNKKPVYFILNKMDLLGARPNVTKEMNRYLSYFSQMGIQFEKQLAICSHNGRNVNILLKQTSRAMPEHPFYYDAEMMSDRPTRFFVSEFVREELFLQMDQELPYSCAVLVDHYEETPNLDRIDATIFLERDSQVGMVVGQGGKRIKDIGSASRKKIEKFLGKKIYLGLQAKKLDRWTENKISRQQLGYES